MMKSRNFVRRYLFTARRHRLDRLRKQRLRCGEADNMEVLAIVLMMKKRFLQAEEVFRTPQPYAFEPTCYSYWKDLTA